VAATGLPVSAKLRAGVTSPERVEDLVLAAADAGAAMVTLHARLRRQSYAEPSTWGWIARAKRALLARGHAIPLVGNGSVERPEDLALLRAETGCDAVMVGRGALADPWIFAQAAGSAAPTAGMAVDFARRYAAAVVATRGERVAVAKLKQLVRWYRCAGLFAGADGEARRQGLLRAESLDEVLQGIDAEALAPPPVAHAVLR
jgi:tRNA-dihydrouridine synthase C